MTITVNELQQMLNEGKRKRKVIKILNKRGFKDVRKIPATKGIDARSVAIQCEYNKCKLVVNGNFGLFGSIGEYDGYEWVWIEETKVKPLRFRVTIMAKAISGR